MDSEPTVFQSDRAVAVAAARRTHTGGSRGSAAYGAYGALGESLTASHEFDSDTDVDNILLTLSREGGFARSQILADLESYEIGSKVPER